MTSVRTAVLQIYHTDQMTYRLCWALSTQILWRHVNNFWTSYLHLTCACLDNPALLFYRFVPDFSSLPLWCILWYMVLRKYCTSDSRLCYIFYFIRWWFIFKPVKHTLKTAYCMWPDYLHALWILIVLPPMHLMTVLQIKYVFSGVKLKNKRFCSI